jgi:MFS transporter, DHA3 family, macrolide efflux protein
MKNKSAVSLLLSANFISGLAQGMSMIAVPMHFAKNGETEWFALAYTAVTLITLFWAPYAGTLTDKYNRKTVFVVLMSVMGILMSAVAALTYFQGALNIWVFAAFGLTFWNYSLHYVCLYAIMQEMTEPAQYKRIASILEVQGQLASALSGAAAALLLDPKMAAMLGLQPLQLYHVFALDAFTYFIGLIFILSMHYESLTVREKESGTVMQRLRTGIGYLKSVPAVFLFGVFSQAVFVAVLLHVFELSPAYVQYHLQPEGDAANSIFAVSEIFYSLGAVFAGLGIQLLFRKSSAVWAIIVLTLITVAEFVFLISFKSVLIFWIMSLFLGITNAGIRVLRVSYLFKVIPNQVAGRANSIFALANTLLRIVFLGIFALPFFHEGGAIIHTFALLNVFMILSVAILYKLKIRE